MTVERGTPRYAVTGLGLGNAEDFRDLIAPFVAELLAEAEAHGCALESSTASQGDDTPASFSERGPAVATAGHDLVIGFLLVFTGSIAGGVAQAVGADIYQHALKQPVANLVQRLRKKSAHTRQVTLLAETWIAEDRVLVQAVVQWHPDRQADLPGVLTDALGVAETFWRAQDSSSSTPASAVSGTSIVRVEIAPDGTVIPPVLVEPRHRMPGMPRHRPPGRLDFEGGDHGHHADQRGDSGASPTIT